MTETVISERVRAIAATVRRLRKSRGWTQWQLAARLEISQSRLSELERCGGSFTAEQLITMLSIFETTVDEFVLRRKPKPPIDDPNEAIIAAIDGWTTNALLAAAPRMVHEIDRVQLQTILFETFGIEHRFLWFVENVRAAIKGDERYRHVEAVLAELMRTARDPSLPAFDAVDGPFSHTMISRLSSVSTLISNRWCVVSRLTPEDFAVRIEAGR